MGRHRRSDAGRAATGRAAGGTRAHRSGAGGEAPPDSFTRAPFTRDRVPMGIAPYLNPEAYADANARSTAYLYAVDDRTPPAAGGGSAPGGGTSPSQGHRRRKAGARPVRTGLLGVSAAVALGTAAVATGVVPGLENYQLGGATHTTGGERVQGAVSPSNTAAEQGGTSGSADSRTGGAPTDSAPGTAALPAPSASASRSASSPSAPASRTPAKKPSESPAESPAKTSSQKPAPATPPTTAPSRAATRAPAASSAPVTVSARAAAEAEVLRLVNEERAKVGCSALAANSSLTGLAEGFSDDMAARGFFDHTDPDGASPWDRAAKAGITGLGGENIARGQADAAAVMQAWMNSPGHRANILNCDFKTLGVGVHFGAGGPWWTQDFGY
ncbi:CAP domain-containing protein [Streptomyces bungoensis]|uniref:CAP domain-containing protein n=1 Tax=Streptomyces bungoensis TaxID=285568 RepID=UPI0033F712BC